MILGMSVSAFTMLHVALSLTGIVCGLIVLLGMIAGVRLNGLTTTFLVTTFLTSVTGFPIPPLGLDPPRIVGTASLVMLALAVSALYVFRLSGSWRNVYVITAAIALYLNCFVAVVQSFQKLPPLQALAPTQSEPPFLIAQAAVLAAFVALGFLASRRFHPRAKAAVFGLP